MLDGQRVPETFLSLPPEFQHYNLCNCAWIFETWVLRDPAQVLMFVQHAFCLLSLPPANLCIVLVNLGSNSLSKYGCGELARDGESASLCSKWRWAAGETASLVSEPAKDQLRAVLLPAGYSITHVLNAAFKHPCLRNSGSQGQIYLNKVELCIHRCTHWEPSPLKIYQVYGVHIFSGCHVSPETDVLWVVSWWFDSRLEKLNLIVKMWILVTNCPPPAECSTSDLPLSNLQQVIQKEVRFPLLTLVNSPGVNTGCWGDSWIQLDMLQARH